MIITIDGPAGSGKTTTARYFAENYTINQGTTNVSFLYMNSGAFYRAVTLWVLCKIAIDDALPYDSIDTQCIEIDRVLTYTKREYKKIVPTLEWNMDGCSSTPLKVMLIGENSTSTIRDMRAYLYSPEVSAFVAQVSCYAPLRAALTKKMQDILSVGNWVVEGRDAGTHIAPHAVLKIYLDVSDSVRIARRHREYADISGNSGTSKQSVRKEIQKRDAIDKNKGKYSLRIDADTNYIQADKYSIEQICDKMYNLLVSSIHF